MDSPSPSLGILHNSGNMDLIGIFRGVAEIIAQGVSEAARTASADTRMSGIHVSIAGRLNTRHVRALCVARRSGRYVKGATGHIVPSGLID